jgi:hypothetical protein
VPSAAPLRVTQMCRSAVAHLRSAVPPWAAQPAGSPAIIAATRATALTPERYRLTLDMSA